jgi:hypothetical protein
MWPNIHYGRQSHHYPTSTLGKQHRVVEEGSLCFFLCLVATVLAYCEDSTERLSMGALVLWVDGMNHLKDRSDVSKKCLTWATSNSYIVIVVSGLCYFITIPLLIFPSHSPLPPSPTHHSAAMASHPSQSGLPQTSPVMSESGVPFSPLLLPFSFLPLAFLSLPLANRLGFACPVGKAAEEGAPGHEVALH